MKKIIVFLMDPPDTIDPSHDTTFALMRAAQELGYPIAYLPKQGISYLNGGRFDVALGDVHDTAPVFRTTTTQTLAESDINSIYIRTDPPFDNTYLHHTWLLDHVTKTVPVFNSPQGIRNTNEKLITLQFPDLIPDTLVTRSIAHYQDFLKTHQKVILKPTDGFGGQSIFAVTADDVNQAVIFETVSQNGTRDCIVQAFIPEAKAGDKRILLLNGEPLGAVLRKNETDHRHNMATGGESLPTDITHRDREIINRITPYLIDNGLAFVGIDILGDYLTEINVTSPTCLQEMSRFQGEDLASHVITRLSAD